MDDALEDAAYEGLSVDLVFSGDGPLFGDLFLLSGDEHPSFSPSGRFPFRELAHLGFQQVDDYFGIPSEADEGDDVVVWLFPVVDGDTVDHHPEPYSAVRLDYSVLRNPVNTLGAFLRCVEVLVSHLDVQLVYSTRDTKLSLAAALAAIKSDALQIVEHWSSEGITPGSSEALEV